MTGDSKCYRKDKARQDLGCQNRVRLLFNRERPGRASLGDSEQEPERGEEGLHSETWEIILDRAGGAKVEALAWEHTWHVGEQNRSS